MELVKVKEKIKIYPAGFVIGEALVRLSWASLGGAIVLVPWRYAWILVNRPQPPVFSDYTNLMVYLSDIPIFLTVLFWLLSLIFTQRRISAQPRPITLVLAGLIAVSALSSFSSVDPIATLYHSGQMLLFYGLYLFLINEVRSLTFFWASAGLSTLIQALVSVGQILRQHSIGLVALQELTLDPAWKGVSVVFASGARTLRAYGLTNHPNLLGGCLAFALLLLMLGFLETHGWKRVLIGIMFGLGTLALLLTFSRAAWLGLAAGLSLIGAYLAVSHSRPAFLAWIGLCVTTFLVMLPIIWYYAPYLSSRLDFNGSFSAATPENQSINERWLLLSQAEKLIVLHPINGVGMAAYPQALHLAIPSYSFDYQPPHLVLAEVAAEIGLPGAAIYMIVLSLPWLLLFNSRKSLRFSIQLAGVTALLSAVSVISFLDYYPWLSNAGSAWQWLIWGLWGGIFLGVSRQSEAT
jgi:O-antigen ligase